MAADTQNKRRSLHGYGLSPLYPVADGTISAPDRAHIAWLYAGLTYASEVVSAGGGGDQKIYERWLVDYPRLEREREAAIRRRREDEEVMMLVVWDA